MPSVLVVGEALVDIVVTPEGEVVEAPGGSPLNVAITLARLGVTTRLLTALGDDERAHRIEAHLEASGVALVDGERPLQRTSTATARMRPDGSATYEFDVVWELAYKAPATPVLHAGSLALFREPGASVVRQLLDASTHTALVSLDPNIRPSLLPDHAQVLAQFETLLPMVHLVKLSDEDAAWLYPDLSERDVVRHLRRRGPALVVVTRGVRGCVLASGEAIVERPAVPTVVVDTIGAGDSFMGALIQQVLSLGLIGDLTRRRALWPEELAAIGDAAATVAALTVSRRGANPPWLPELSAAHGNAASEHVVDALVKHQPLGSFIQFTSGEKRRCGR